MRAVPKARDRQWLEVATIGVKYSTLGRGLIAATLGSYTKLTQAQFIAGGCYS